jgi:hypothetical protein
MISMIEATSLSDVTFLFFRDEQRAPFVLTFVFALKYLATAHTAKNRGTERRGLWESAYVWVATGIKK